MSGAGFPDLTLYDAMVAPGVLRLRDGSFMAAWSVRGPDMASRSAAEMAGLSNQINRILMLGSGWMVQCDAIRSSTEGYPDSVDFDLVTSLIDAERREEFTSASAHFESEHFESEHFFCVTYQPPHKAERKMRGWLYSKSGTELDGDDVSRSIREFAGKVSSIEDNLRSPMNSVRRLGLDAATGHDDLLRYVHRCIAGIDHPITLPEFPFELQDVVACADFAGGNEPVIDGRHLRIVSIDGFPLHSVPGILGVLDTLAMEYRWNTRALLLDAEEAKARIKTKGKDWWFKRYVKSSDSLAEVPTGSVDMDAAQMYSDAMGSPAQNEPGAYGEAAGGLVQFASYSTKVVLMDADPARLRESVARVQKAIRAHGFAARLEQENSVEAFLGSLPGDGHRDVRRVMPHTMNIADMLPLTSVWAGALECPSPMMRRRGDTAPLLMATAAGSSQYRFHIHVGDVGHVAAVGPTGSGKSTFLGLLAASWRARYKDARVFCFDKDHSMFAYTVAAGGEFYDPAKLATEGTALQPLRHLETPSDIAWACEYLETLCVLQGMRLGPRERKLLADGVDLLRGSNSRGLTELVANVQDPHMQDALRQYTEGHELGSLIDGHREKIKDGRLITFELGGLMHMGPRAVSAVLPYLFRRVSRQVEHGTGEPTLIILDEVWLFLQNERFRDQIDEWLRVMRKQNCAVVMATPGLAELFESPIGPVILQACKTKLIFPDAEATNPETMKLYKQLGLRDRECQLIAEGQQKGDVYVVSHDGRQMINVRVGPVGLSFLGANSKEERTQIEALIAKYGRDYPRRWLASRGLADKAGSLMEVETCEQVAV